MLVFALTLAAATLSAQEIRGVVSDPTLNIGIAGATVTLSQPTITGAAESSFATAITDSQGVFRFTPAKFGKYNVAVQKDSLMDSVQTGFGPRFTQTVTLSAEHPSADLRFSLIQPGQITGRVVDEDANPVGDLTIAVHSKSASAVLTLVRAATAKDGTFTIPNIPPGSYIVEAIPPLGAAFKVFKFSEPDFNIVDRDFEGSYWPGGASDPRSASPVTVSPGGLTSVGVIKLRKVPYYRVHVSLNENCAAGTDWKLIVAGAATYSAPAHFPCMKEFLVANVKPGSYQFAFSNEQYGRAARWALLPVQVTNRNLEIKLSMSPPADLRGRIVTLNDAPMPSVTMLKLNPIPAMPGLMQQLQTTSVDADGAFFAQDLPWPREQLTLAGLGSSYYVKEIRVAGVASPDQTVPLIPGASPPIEIVVDNQAATLSGSVLDGDKPVREATILLSPSSRPTVTGEDGRFQIGGLAPGEYRVLAVPSLSALDADAINRLLTTAPSVTLERGASKTISLRLSDPSH